MQGRFLARMDASFSAGRGGGNRNVTLQTLQAWEAEGIVTQVGADPTSGPSAWRMTPAGVAQLGFCLHVHSPARCLQTRDDGKNCLSWTVWEALDFLLSNGWSHVSKGRRKAPPPFTPDGVRLFMLESHFVNRWYLYALCNSAEVFASGRAGKGIFHKKAR